jgi:hypothetical protein
MQNVQLNKYGKGLFLTLAAVVLVTAGASVTLAKTALRGTEDVRTVRVSQTKTGNETRITVYRKHKQPISFKAAVNQVADTHYCCDADGCTPISGDILGPAHICPVILWCDDNGICSPQ